MTPPSKSKSHAWEVEGKGAGDSRHFSIHDTKEDAAAMGEKYAAEKQPYKVPAYAREAMSSRKMITVNPAEQVRLIKVRPPHLIKVTKENDHA